MKQELELVQTRIKVNKKIFRMGMEARPLLVVLSIMLCLGTILVGFLGIIGFGLCLVMIFGFVKLKNYLTSEIEKGNLTPLDSFLNNLSKPESLKNDDVIELLKSRQVQWKN